MAVLSRKRLVSLLCGTLLFYAVAQWAQADGLKINRLPSNSGSIETAKVSYRDHRVYVNGWARSHFFGSGEVSIRVDMKDAEGQVNATKTQSIIPTGRPKIWAMLGSSFSTSFAEDQVKTASAVDVTCVK